LLKFAACVPVTHADSSSHLWQCSHSHLWHCCRSRISRFRCRRKLAECRDLRYCRPPSFPVSIKSEKCLNLARVPLKAMSDAPKQKIANARWNRCKIRARSQLAGRLALLGLENQPPSSAKFSRKWFGIRVALAISATKGRHPGEILVL
jgi:hypothetical protein